MPHGGMLSVKFLSVIEQSGRLQPGMVPILFGQYHIRRRNSPIASVGSFQATAPSWSGA